MRYLLACIVVILLAFNTSSVLARDMNTMPEVTGGQVNEALNNLTPVRFFPNNPLYFLIRGKEIITRFFQPSFRERAQFDYTISSKRLKEAYLLTSRGDTGKTRSELSSYIATLGRIEGQLEKARSQNQDVTVIVDKIADNLIYQEVLLSSLSNLGDQDRELFGDKLEEGLNSFGDFVLYLDKIKPGLRSRFKLFTKESVKQKSQNEIVVSPSPALEATGRAKPRRIIF